jgi:uncharacterized membrane protein
VTILDAAVPRNGVRHHLLWLVISLSLALNLFFAAGVLWTRFHTPRPLTREQQLEEMARALALDPQQRPAFARYAQTMRGRLQEMRRAVQPLVRAAWSEVAKPQADENKVMQLLDRAALARRGYLNDITSDTIAFLRILSPEQRAEFVKLVHQGPPPWALQFSRQRD